MYGGSADNVRLFDDYGIEVTSVDVFSGDENSVLVVTDGEVRGQTVPSVQHGRLLLRAFQSLGASITALYTNDRLC